METKKSLNYRKSPNSQHLQNIPANLHNKYDKYGKHNFWHFLWNGPDKVKRNTVIADYDKGGLEMAQIESIVNTQKMWAKIFLSFNFHPWKEFRNTGLKI